MLRVAEVKADFGFRVADAVCRTGFVTGRARTDVFIIHHFIGSMTLKTGFVRGGANRNGHPDAFGFMTGRAIRLADVPGVVEMRPEALHRRKRF